MKIIGIPFTSITSTLSPDTVVSVLGFVTAGVLLGLTSGTVGATGVAGFSP